MSTPDPQPYRQPPVGTAPFALPDEPDPAATALVFVAGGILPIETALKLPDAAYVVSADAGLSLALGLGYRSDVVVGDLDSVAADALDAATAAGTRIERHPADKDATDLDLAVQAAIAAGAQRIVVVGGDGGRFDHVVANALVLAAPAYAQVRIEARYGTARIWVVHDTIAMQGIPGEYLTLLAVGGTASGVQTHGLRWALTGEALHPGSSRGVSNEFAEANAAVQIADGTLLAIAPGVAPSPVRHRPPATGHAPPATDNGTR